MQQKFSDDCFLLCLSFLVDIFESANSVNLALQGKDMDVIQSRGKLTAFQMKLNLWLSKIGQ